MKQYDVTGMSCAACSARVEKAVGAVEGVTACTVSLLTNSMSVEGSAPAEKVIQAVQAAGYGASVKGAAKASADEGALADRETPVLKKRLIASLCLLLPLMYISMGHMMWGWKLPAFFAGNHLAMGLAELILSAAVMVINQKFFISGFKGLIHRAPNMDTLVAMGSGVSFGWSLWVLFEMTRSVTDGDKGRTEELMMNFYFESAAMILTLITVGKLLEARSKGKTTDALKSLMRLTPKTAAVEREGKETVIAVEEVRVGDIFLVRPGDSIPVDGVVIEGESAVNEAALTGESIPADKQAGSKVSAATINTTGFLRCRAERVGEDTTLAQIIKMVSDAAATKAPIAKIADRVSGVFVPTVIGISALTLIIWLAVGQSAGYALARAISVLVISCPCALGLATPVAIMVGSGMGAKNGILFKTAVSLEETGRVQIAALDKTGTVTKGEPAVTDVLPAEGVTAEELLLSAGALEKMSEHPLAAAVRVHCEEKGLSPEEVTEFKALSGSGLRGRVGGKEVAGGNIGLISRYCTVDDKERSLAEKLAEEGKTPLYFAKGGKLLGIIAAADSLKEESIEAIKQLKAMGIAVVMLTGDNERTARAVGRQAGVDRVIAGVLPAGKESVIRKLQACGRVAMVGDGINDAPALTRADMGIAIGAGADVAVDAADVVLVNSRLTDVPAAIRLSRLTLRSIHQNLFWAFIYNIIGIPLAAGAFIKLFGWELQPMFGAAAMSLSSFTVVTNALRLNLKDIFSPKHDKKREAVALPEDLAPEQQQTYTMRIEGMMCPHCEATVKKVLESFEEVDEAVCSFTEGTAVLTLSAPLSRLTEMEEAVIKKGYEVIK
ncbi:heavy metal translocating P-type ATPase [Ruminococcus sp.]|uniref:heavy metal translocating P-type ATPase n=1 Tax=Ruminococcus sp. TaxID=41978 RepID=UPI0025D1D551|nr:heavy metal translocating P-type ATPase [Ruminococcus sp.]MBQ8966311.1 heavy metal translocating P-type ATPase [Ruminococcus sp.]